ncbi:MFS transporter [Camelliibacillus cellulosilyticus]|uniref:MFS transporter n=1 Tax=Camelliibacillus cellulosilyticus TaxID=2174486 RepID=A0ABV9GMF3_9BACL
MLTDHKCLKKQRTIVIIALVTALGLAGDSMLYIALPIYWREAGLTAIWQVGVLLSINRFIRLPINPFVGWLYRKVSLRTGLFLAAILGMITTAGYGMAKGFFLWLLLRCLWGLAWSLFRIGGLQAVVQYAGTHNRGQMMGTYNGLHRLGSLFGMLIGGIFVPIIGLKSVSLIFGAISLLGLPLLFQSLAPRSALGNDANRPSGATAMAWRLYIKNGWFMIVSGFFINMLFTGVLTSTLSVAVEIQNIKTLSLFGLAISITALSGLLQAARWTWEPFLARGIGSWSDGPRGRGPILIGSLIVAAISFGFVSMTLPIYAWMAVVLIVMLSATALTTLTDSLAADAAKAINSVSFLAIYTIAQDLGAALGPAIGYIFLPLTYGLQFIYWGGALLFLVIAALWVCARRQAPENTGMPTQLNVAKK